MELKLNPTQQEFLEFVREEGHVTFEQTAMFWTTPRFRKTNLERFIMAGILKESSESVGRFEYVKV